MKRSATAAEKSHMGRVHALGCIVCLECLGQVDTPAIVHHVRSRHGWGRSSHMDTIPLCYWHHVEPNYGVHGMGRDEFTALYGKSEMDLLTVVNEILGVEAKEKPASALTDLARDSTLIKAEE